MQIINGFFKNLGITEVSGLTYARRLCEFGRSLEEQFQAEFARQPEPVVASPELRIIGEHHERGIVVEYGLCTRAWYEALTGAR